MKARVSGSSEWAEQNRRIKLFEMVRQKHKVHLAFLGLVARCSSIEDRRDWDCEGTWLS